MFKDATSIQLTDQDGNEIFRCTDCENSLDLSKLEPGRYLLKITTSTNVSVQEIIKE